MTTRTVVRTLGGYSAYSLRAEAGWGLEVIPGYGARLNALWLCDGPLCLIVIDGLDAEAEPENAGPYHCYRVGGGAPDPAARAGT